MLRFMSVGAALILSGAAVFAADIGARSNVGGAAPLLSEVRLGVFMHDPVSAERGAADVNGEVLFAPFGWDRTSRWGWLTPRVHVGATGNFNGGTSAAYTGFTWTLDVTPSWFVEAALGGAVHSGDTGTPSAGRNAMGCRFAFHEAASVGYRIAPGWTVMGTVEHYSNAGLCDRNRGLTNMGVRVGYVF